MKLIHVFIATHKSARDLNVSLTGPAKCIFANGHVEIEWRRDTSSYYHGHHCSAIIGANGVGKSSVLDFIESSYYMTDSSGLLVFFDESNDSFHICLINIRVSSCSMQATIYGEFEEFAHRHKIKLIKINNVSDAQGRLGYEKKFRHPLIQNRSLEDYTRLKPKRKRYFDNLLRYFKWNAGIDNLIEDVGFEFNFHDSSEKIDRFLNESDLQVDYIDDYRESLSYLSTVRRLYSEAYAISPHHSLKEHLSILNVSPLIMDLASEVKGSLRKYISSFLQYYFLISVKSKKDTILRSLRRAVEALRYSENWNIFKSQDIKNMLLKEDVDISSMHEKLNYSESILADIAHQLSDHVGLLNDDSGVSFLVDDFHTVSEVIGLSNALSRNTLSNISWGWRGISTGEMARSHLLSETFDCLRRSEGGNFIIVIDEVDLYLHPEWQRSFLDSYLTLLNEVEGVMIKPQILLTTHSPIIVSDFLPQDIVSLAKDDDGGLHIRDSLGFGTNITNLFIDGMHVESTFGEHSRKAIVSLMEKAKEGTLSELDRTLIGEMGNKYVRDFLLKND